MFLDLQELSSFHSSRLFAESTTTLWKLVISKVLYLGERKAVYHMVPILTEDTRLITFGSSNSYENYSAEQSGVSANLTRIYPTEYFECPKITEVMWVNESPIKWTYPTEGLFFPITTDLIQIFIKSKDTRININQTLT